MHNIYELRNPRDLLSLTTRKLRIASNATITFERFPDLGVAAENLAWHISDRIMFPMPWPFQSEVPLLDMCIRCAFEWMSFRLEMPGITARDVQTSFLAGLMFHTPEVAHVQVRQGNEQWDPFLHASLTEWLPKHPGATLQVRPTHDSGTRLADRAIRMALLSRIFPNAGVAAIDVQLSQVLFPPEDIQPPRDYDGR